MPEYGLKRNWSDIYKILEDRKLRVNAWIYYTLYLEAYYG